jgi:hypothetical protein
MAATSYYDDKHHTLEHFDDSPDLTNEFEHNERGRSPSQPTISYAQSDATFPGSSDVESSLRRKPSEISLPNPNRFTYFDEDFNYYPSHGESQPSTATTTQAPLVYNAADVGRSVPGDKSNYQDLGMLLCIATVAILNVSQNTRVIRNPSGPKLWKQKHLPWRGS